MILVKLSQAGSVFCAFTEDADTADLYISYAQTCGYGISVERID